LVCRAIAETVGFLFVPHVLSAVRAGCLMLQGIEEQEV
jgi:hypothetical protein